MKLKIKLGAKKPAISGKPRTSSPSLGSTPSWLTTDPVKQKERVKQAQAASGRDFIPELWVMDGEDKRVRFCFAAPSAIIEVYNVKLRNGRFAKFTKPVEDETDLFQDELGLRPATKAIYIVDDIDGYVDKKTNKRKKHQVRFFIAGTRQYQQLEKIREKRSGLNNQDIEISRSGQKMQTTYTFMPDERTPGPAPEIMKQANELKAQMVKLFAPLSEAEQRAILPQIVTDRSDD